MRRPMDDDHGAVSGVRGRSRISIPMRLLRITVLLVAALAVISVGVFLYCVRMPGDSFAGQPGTTVPGEVDLARRLEADVTHLCRQFPERNWTRPEVYGGAADWVERRLGEAGCGTVARQSYTARGESYHNLVATVAGGDLAREIVVIGAHYDAVSGTVGADDNASGVAALLALAERARGWEPRRTVRFVAFANEEPPHFQTEEMGSLVHARAARAAGDAIVAMLSFDGVGFYAAGEDTQHYPSVLALAYPSRGDFVAFVGNPASRALVHRSVAAFRTQATIPSEGAVLPSALTGVGWSDHWSFWQCGYPAIEITDTLPFRYAHYHRATDTPDRLDYAAMARVVVGVEAVLRDLGER